MARNADDLQVYVAGEILPRGQARVSVFDASFQSGDAVWEGLRAYYGHIFELDAHLRRLYDSAKALDIVIPLMPEELKAALYETLAANSFDHGIHIRLMVSRGERFTSGMNPRNVEGQGRVVIIPELKPIPIDPTPITLHTAATRRPAPDALNPGIHHANQLNSILAKLEANRVGADGAIMLDHRGFVAETESANIFLVKQGELATPRAVACLHGITRQLVLREARHLGMSVTESDLTLFDFFSADEVFVTGTAIELVPVGAIDGRTIGTGSMGPMTSRLLAAYRELTVRGNAHEREHAKELHDRSALSRNDSTRGL